MIQTVTRLGTRALAEALSSSASITFTKCAIGSGAFNPNLDDPRMMEGLIDPAADLAIVLVRKEDDGVAVVADLDNTAVAGGTVIREFGVFAKANDGEEFLFSYAYADAPEVVPPPEESTYERRFVSHFAMSDDELELVVTYELLADLIENDLSDALDTLLDERKDRDGGYVSYEKHVEDLDGKLDKGAAGATGGVAQLDENGKVPLEQLPDNMGREFATREEVRARLYGYTPDDPAAYYASIAEDQIADSDEVRAVWNGEPVEAGDLPVPSRLIAVDDEVKTEFINNN